MRARPVEVEPVSYLVSCDGCGTTALVPDHKMQQPGYPEAAVVCRDPAKTGCCTIDHDHRVTTCDADHSSEPCAQPAGSLACTVASEVGEDCPGGHHSSGLESCAACRSLTITVPEGEGPVIRPGPGPASAGGIGQALVMTMLMRFLVVRLLFLWTLVMGSTILERARQTSLLASILNGTTWPVVPAGWKMRLLSTAPTVTADGTELTGSGYTAGGTAFTSQTVAAAATTLPVAALTWTNGSGGAWSIVGLSIWDTAGTPLRWLWGLWTGQPISVAISNTFQVAINAVSADATPW